MPSHRAIVLTSVPHTGTIFTVKLFTRRGFDNRNLNQYPAGHDCVYFDHCIKPGQVDFALDLIGKGLPLVCPLRHPYLVEEAWLRRGGKDMRNLVTAFTNLFERFAPLDPYWMPVDSDARYGCLDRMREGLGIPFETDWAPQHTFQNTHSLSWRDCEPSPEIRAMVDKFQPSLEPFYT